jgi:hypothetical protein
MHSGSVALRLMRDNLKVETVVSSTVSIVSAGFTASISDGPIAAVVAGGVFVAAWIVVALVALWCAPYKQRNTLRVEVAILRAPTAPLEKFRAELRGHLGVARAVQSRPKVSTPTYEERQMADGIERVCRGVKDELEAAGVEVSYPLSEILEAQEVMSRRRDLRLVEAIQERIEALDSLIVRMRAGQ